MSRRWTSLGIVGVCALLTLPFVGARSAADQPRERNGDAEAQAAPRDAQDAAAAAIALGRRLEQAGRTSDAAVQYLIAAELAPDLDRAREALRRLAGRTPEPRREDDEAAARRLELSGRLREERAARRALERTVERLNDRLSSQTQRLDQLDRELDDKGRAERIVDRLDREIDQLGRDLERLRREVDRTRRNVDRLRREIR